MKNPVPYVHIHYDTGIVARADVGGVVWHVYSNGQEILTTPDREYALRALKRAVERELAKGSEGSP